jgi:AbiJ N-terminal domain 4
MSTGNHDQNADPLAERKKLSFEQAEGIVPMPSQFARGEISREFRAVLWDLMRRALLVEWDRMTGTAHICEPWPVILSEAHVYRDHRLDEFPKDYDEALQAVRARIERGEWSDILGWLEWIFKHPSCPSRFPSSVDFLLAHCRLGYRIFDNMVICPIGSDAERASIERAFVDLAAIEFNGARTHLRKAAEELTAGHYADSVRESIHAVEGVARVLESRATLSGALDRLEKSVKIHSAMKRGFLSLYGYTSDEDGIRHALLEGGAPKVDETDALFMIGACAAFVSYLINKARSADILNSA